MKKNLTYKKCVLKDLEVLTSVSRDTFISAFAKDNNPDDFKSYIDTAFNKNQIEQELLNPQSEFYFVFLNRLLAGYFKLNINDAQDEAFGNSSIELSRIYVFNEFQGQGLGADVLNKIISLAKEKQKTWLWLGVWQLNVNAVRFYERHGFTKFDTHSFYIGNDRQTDWLMRLDMI